MAMRPRTGTSGFTLNELLVVMTMFAILAGISVPIAYSLSERMRVNGARSELERELQTARLKAVSVNRPLQLRLNCPATGSYRMVEVMSSGIDNSTGRCSPATYPFRGVRDDDPASPDFDGPVRTLPAGVSFSSSALVVFQFQPDGRTSTVSGTTQQAIGSAGVDVTVAKGDYTGTINVNSLGRISIR